MRNRIFAALIASLALAAQANEELSLKNKALAAAGASAKQSDAPFTYGRDPMPQILMMEEQARKGLKGACEYSARDLCYDLTDGRVVYRPARKYMPRFEGLTPENVTFRANRIVFKYSFK